MNLAKNQKGFGLVEGLLLVITLTLVAGVGYYVYRSQQDNQASQQTAQNQKEHENKDGEEEHERKEEFFKFKELGVKIPLSEGLKGLRYSSSRLAGFTYYNVTTDKLTKDVIKCNSKARLTTSDTSFGSLSKSEGTFNPGMGQAKLLKQFDDFYITMSSPQDSLCDDATSAKAGEVAEYVAELKGSLQKAFEGAKEI